MWAIGVASPRGAIKQGAALGGGQVARLPLRATWRGTPLEARVRASGFNYIVFGRAYGRIMQENIRILREYGPKIVNMDKKCILDFGITVRIRNAFHM